MDRNDPNNTKWFSGKTVLNARKILKRWTEEKKPDDMAICGQIYSQYFTYKLDNVLHKTKLFGEQNFSECFNRQGYYVLKHIFRPRFLKIMKTEVLASSKLDWGKPPVSREQVETCPLSNFRLEDPNAHGGCEFLHHFLSGVVAGSFPKKIFFDLTIMKTVKPKGREWVDCVFHQDCLDPPAHYLDRPESPITLYFTCDNESIHLDVKPTRQKSGPDPKARTIKLESGDIMIFDPCKTSHRTSRPTKETTPYRINVVLTGIEEYLSMDAISVGDGSLADSQDTISD